MARHKKAPMFWGGGSKLLPNFCPLASNSTPWDPTEPHTAILLTSFKCNVFRNLENSRTGSEVRCPIKTLTPISSRSSL
jgi:hypothetical protein